MTLKICHFTFGARRVVISENRKEPYIGYDDLSIARKTTRIAQKNLSKAGFAGFKKGLV